MALARCPDLGLAVGVDAGDCRVRLDIGLVDGGGLELLFDDEIGLGKTLVEVADREFEPLRDVGRLGRRRLDTAGDHVFEQQRRIGRHRFIDIDDVRQNFVIDVDQLGRCIGGRLVDRRDGSDGMALIERLFARHHIAGDMPEILRDPLRADILEFLVGEIGAGNDRLDAGERNAFEASIERMRACACGERMILP